VANVKSSKEECSGLCLVNNKVSGKLGFILFIYLLLLLFFFVCVYGFSSVFA